MKSKLGIATAAASPKLAALNTKSSASTLRRTVLGTVTNIAKPASKGPSKPPPTTKQRTVLADRQHSQSQSFTDTKLQRPNTHAHLLHIHDIHDSSSNETDYSEEAKLSPSGASADTHYSDDTELEYDEDDAKFIPEPSPSSTIEEKDNDYIYNTIMANPPRYCVSSFTRSTCNPGAIRPVWDQASIEAKAQLTAQFENMPGIFDENDEDTYDISMAAEYSNDIVEYMRELEFRYLPDVGYMERQMDLDWNKRGILMEWLVRVHDHCNFLPETLFLTIHYVDRFLSLKAIRQNKLQLVGVVALFVAAKYEEIVCPSVVEVAYMVDHEYTVDEILRAERYMINLLEFNLGWPGPMSFLRRSSKADDYDSDTRTIAKYLLELTIMDERFVGSPASWLAAAAHCLARKILNRGPWTDTHAYFAGYTEPQLTPAVDLLLKCCKNAETRHAAVFRKYKDQKFKWVSLHVANWIAGH